MALGIMPSHQKTVTIVHAPGTDSETRSTVQALIQSSSGMFDVTTQIYEGDIVEVDDPRGFVDSRTVGTVKVNDIGSAHMHHIHVDWAPKQPAAPSRKGVPMSAPKVFISHAFADRKVADALKDTLLMSGLSPSNIFYSSDKGTGITTGGDLRSKLLAELRDAVIVIEILTEAFVSRPLCLMELGGAWALENPTYPIVVPPYTIPAATARIGELVMASVETPEAIADLLHELPGVLHDADPRLVIQFEPRHAEQFKDRLAAALPPPGGASFSLAPSLVAAGGQPNDIALFKRWIRDPTKAVELEELVSDAVGKVAAQTRETVSLAHADHLMDSDLVAHYQGLLGVARPAIELLQVGIRFDRARTHDEVWVDAIRGLMSARKPVPFGVSYQSQIEESRHLPALYALRAAGMTALMHDADPLFIKLFLRPTWRDEKYPGYPPLQAVDILQDYELLDRGALRLGEPTRWRYPPSHFLRASMRELFQDVTPDDADYQRLHDHFEYGRSLIEAKVNESITPGEFIGDGRWSTRGLEPEGRFKDEASDAGDSVWRRLLAPQDVDQAFTAHRDRLFQARNRS